MGSGLESQPGIIAVDIGGGGCELHGTGNHQPRWAVNMVKNVVEVYDATFTEVRSFGDATLGADFAPFGVRDINGLVYVTFASISGNGGGA